MTKFKIYPPPFFSPKAGDINSLNLRGVFLSTAVTVKETFKPMVCRFAAYYLWIFKLTVV